MFVIILVLSSLLITPYFRGGLPGGRLRREKVDKDGRELPTKKKGGGELPTGGLLASGCTTAYIGIFIIMLGMSHLEIMQFLLTMFKTNYHHHLHDHQS